MNAKKAKSNGVSPSRIKRCGCGRDQWPTCADEYWVKACVTIDGKQIYPRGPASKYTWLWKKDQPLPQPMKEADYQALEALMRMEMQRVRGPLVPPKAVVVHKTVTAPELLDLWWAWREPRLRGKKEGNINAVTSSYAVAKRYVADMTVDDLERPATYQAFEKSYTDRGYKASAAWSIMRRVLRPAVLWAIAQTPLRAKQELPPLMTLSPFGQRGYGIGTGQGRKERCVPDVEARLLAACDVLDAPQYQYCGRYLRDFIKIGIDLGMRGTDEILSLHTDMIDWNAKWLGLGLTKNGDPRNVPFNDKGRVGAILNRYRFVPKGQPVSIVQDMAGHGMKKIYRAWVHLVCIAFDIPFVQTGHAGRPTKATIAAYKKLKLTPHVLRHEAQTWMGLKRVRQDTIDLLLGYDKQSTSKGYRHADFERARDDVREMLWPRECERAVRDAQDAKEA